MTHTEELLTVRISHITIGTTQDQLDTWKDQNPDWTISDIPLILPSYHSQSLHQTMTLLFRASRSTPTTTHLPPTSPSSNMTPPPP